MNAMVLHDWVTIWGHNLKYEKVPTPKPSPQEVLVKVRACGVGLPAANFMMGEAGKDPKLLPKIPGDEIAGEIVQVGSSVSAFKEGDRVIDYIFITCGECEFCLSGEQSLCTRFGGWVGRHVNGGYAEYVKLPASSVFKLPDGISFLDATAICTAISSPLHVLRSRVNLQPGDSVMIIGAAGGVGVHAIQVAKLYGARVIAVDIDDSKLDKLREFGIDVLINARNVDLPQEVRKVTAGRGVDLVIDYVGVPKTLTDAVSSLARRGKFVNLTTHPGTKFEVESSLLVREEISITGSRYASKSDVNEAISLVKAGKIRPVITETVNLQDVEKLHVKMVEGRLFGRGATVIAD